MPFTADQALARAFSVQALSAAHLEAARRANYAQGPDADLHARVLADVRAGKIVRHQVTIPEGATSETVIELLNAEEALTGLAERAPRKAKVVELRFFGGLENEEVAQVLGISLATVKRDWTLARAWLHRALATR